MRQLILSDNWQLKQRDPARALDDDFTTGDWLPARVPGSVHEALLAAGVIPDPFYGTNETAVQWIGEVDWLYRCLFDLSDERASETAALCCDGLDTIATVWLNDQQIAASDKALAERTGQWRKLPSRFVLVHRGIHRTAYEAGALDKLMQLFGR